MLRVGIVGVSGFTGLELVKLLLHHPWVEIDYLAARSHVGQPLSDVFPSLKNICDNIIEPIDENKCVNLDVVFLALPHGVSMELVCKLFGKVRIIDLSADFRLPKDLYEKWYKPHLCPDLIKEAVYGLPELNRQKIKKASLIANPGCYATASILAVLPFLDIIESDIIIDAKSGVTGAGKTLREDLLFSEIEASFKAYSPASHRHQPEIQNVLSLTEPVNVTFVPHLLPINRGILATVYAKLKSFFDEAFLFEKLQKFYINEPFVRVSKNLPKINNTSGTNYCDVSFALDKENNRLIILSVVDNLLKGASSQALQNMNIMFGLKEEEGLKLKPHYP
ncbi:N-acetyl-gamma-glutamyl-phosphate reductase [Desulfurella sp.]|uniref:N-acetyl-gamma-glutamyl-phosphate reductase n=1 Tax=Desulfurella sp. TaxID=1962857 RepID=UPI0025B8AAF0|nr:N-acetyl-gamma-glutamyl-phosphate reductase [Desulfurella sp.]